MFEPVTGLVGGMLTESLEGWNIVRLTLDTSTFDVTDASIETDVEINDYLNIVPDDGNTMTLTGAGATLLFNGLVCGEKYVSKGLYVKDGTWQNASDVKDATMLSLTTYESLVLRDEVTSESINDVPVYVTGNIGNICDLTEYEDGNNDDYIALAEVRQYDTGMPLRMLKVQIGGVYAAYIPETWNVNGSLVLSKGWIANDQPTTRPTIEGFSPTRFSFGNDTYDNLDNLPKDAKSALYSLSQCINTSAEAMGHISVEDDSVLRFNGTVKPNQKYHFTTGNDCALNLPNVGFSETDSQFVIYLTCTSDVDFTFPAGTYFTNTPNTETGEHKLIGSYLPKAGKWSSGGIDYEVAT